MTYIDSAILDLTEWFCRKFQRLTGRTNVWLAVQLTNLSIVVYFVWAGVIFWSEDVAVRLALGLFCSGLLYVLTQTIFKVPIEAYENEAFRRVARGFRNPRRVRDARLRISFLTLCFVLFYPILLVSIFLRVHAALLSYSLIVLTTVVLYLLACDPLPPCAGTLRAWLRGSAPSRLAVSESPGGRGDFSLPARPDQLREQPRIRMVRCPRSCNPSNRLGKLRVTMGRGQRRIRTPLQPPDHRDSVVGKRAPLHAHLGSLGRRVGGGGPLAAAGGNAGCARPDRVHRILAGRLLGMGLLVLLLHAAF